jgi:hypothetical protein
VGASALEIEPSIVYSKTYRVPVLYFIVIDPSSARSFSVEEVYDAVVPPTQRAQLTATSVMGAISHGVSRACSVSE